MDLRSRSVTSTLHSLRRRSTWSCLENFGSSHYG
ncbi:hypothetical protein L917_09960 [Phytophthora nicotianae]|uniref:Uncharacterized protein n=1 Tax=Phytophthora nicotianae TaxID=4792 RepID=W2L236_PHYNI|nr:hypothetical protein L916_10030 [Phytophthora nicotianae]ETL91498.1 hypothetical protein L917_09960 [Phytophthora nicotianae]